jgi:hypothetical protein
MKVTAVILPGKVEHTLTLSRVPCRGEGVCLNRGPGDFFEVGSVIHYANAPDGYPVAHLTLEPAQPTA